MKINSKYFTFDELIVSKTGLLNIPNQAQLENMQELVTNILDPLRSLYGKPIKTNSVFRSPAVNKMVKGSPTSDHMKGMAADIDTAYDNEKLYNLIKNNFKFTQLINESNFSWVHVSYDKNNLKCQLLKL
jgi:hypothetical protein